MLCDRCRKNEASVRVIRIVNGARYEQSLCADCAAEETNRAEAPQQQAAPAASGGFGLDQLFNFLRHIGLIGVVMAPPQMMMQHRMMQHMQIPDLEDLGLTLPACGEEGAAHGAGSIEALKAELTSAVLHENFERAAELRDTIYRMEHKESAGQS